MAKIIAEPVKIGDQTFVKDDEKGWIDQKTKKPADPSLVKLLDTLDLKPLSTVLKKSVDTSIEPVKLGDTTYVYDRNAGWIDKKSGETAPPKMQAVLDPLKTERTKKPSSAKSKVARAAMSSMGIVSSNKEFAKEGNSQADIVALSNGLASTLAIVKNVNTVLANVIALDRFKYKETARIQREVSREGGALTDMAGVAGAIIQANQEAEAQRNGNLISSLIGGATIAGALALAKYHPFKSDEETSAAAPTGGGSSPRQVQSAPEQQVGAVPAGRSSTKVEIKNADETAALSPVGQRGRTPRPAPKKEKEAKPSDDKKKLESKKKPGAAPAPTRMQQYSMNVAKAGTFGIPAGLMSDVSEWKKAFLSTIDQVVKTVTQAVTNAVEYINPFDGGTGTANDPASIEQALATQRAKESHNGQFMRYMGSNGKPVPNVQYGGQYGMGEAARISAYRSLSQAERNQIDSITGLKGRPPTLDQMVSKDGKSFTKPGMKQVDDMLARAFMQDTFSVLQKSLGRQPTNADVRGYWWMGPGGYPAFVKDLNKNPEMTMDQFAMKHGYKSWTQGPYKDQWMTKENGVKRYRTLREQMNVILQQAGGTGIVGDVQAAGVATIKAVGKVASVITSGIVQRSYGVHAGIDIGVPGNKIGTPIASIGNGIVYYAGWGKKGTGFGGYGNVVAITHSDGPLKGITALYGHLSAINNGIQVGKPVSAGQILGGMGNTGFVMGATGVHLHLEFRRTPNVREKLRQNVIDPTPWFNANKWVVGGPLMQSSSPSFAQPQQFTPGIDKVPGPDPRRQKTVLTVDQSPWPTQVPANPQPRIPPKQQPKQPKSTWQGFKSWINHMLP